MVRLQVDPQEDPEREGLITLNNGALLIRLVAVLISVVGKLV